MKSFNRFHLLCSLRYIKYALLLCVLPMLQAFLRFDWQSLLLALRQDLFILFAFKYTDAAKLCEASQAENEAL